MADHLPGWLNARIHGALLYEEVYCCVGFKNLISCAGDRGHAVLESSKPDEGIRFLLQSRGLAFGDEQNWSPNNAPDAMINISAEIGLSYCPFCGQRLEELAGGHRDPYGAMAKNHSKYLETIRRP